MREITEVNIQEDGWVRIDPAILEKIGILGGKARCIFTGYSIILMPYDEERPSLIIDFMRKHLSSPVSHEQAQKALSSIKGSLSQAIIEDREERL